MSIFIILLRLIFISCFSILLYYYFARCLLSSFSPSQQYNIHFLIVYLFAFFTRFIYLLNFPSFYDEFYEPINYLSFSSCFLHIPIQFFSISQSILEGLVIFILILFPPLCSAIFLHCLNLSLPLFNKLSSLLPLFIFFLSSNSSLLLL